MYDSGGRLLTFPLLRHFRLIRLGQLHRHCVLLALTRRMRAIVHAHLAGTRCVPARTRRDRSDGGCQTFADCDASFGSFAMLAAPKAFCFRCAYPYNHSGKEIPPRSQLPARPSWQPDLGALKIRLDTHTTVAVLYRDPGPGPGH